MNPLADEPMTWPVSESKVLHRDDWVLGLRRDTISAPGKPEEQFSRIVVEDPGAVVILAIDDEDNVVVVRQYRHPAEHRFVELPAGVLDEEGEEPEAAARRELLEEAGLEADHWQHLITTYPTPGKSQEKHVIFLAHGLREVDSGYVATHEEAEMSLERVPFAELVDGVLEGRLTDGPLVIAVLAHDAIRRGAR